MKIAETSTAGRFEKTAWSTVLEAKADEEEVRQRALERLFQRYRMPIVREIQARWRCQEASAEDLAHDFIGQCLRRDFLRKLEPQQGRFRSFLHRCLTNFLNDAHRRSSAEKRGGGAVPLSLDETDEAGAKLIDPEDKEPRHEVMDRAWALQVVSEALTRLEQECAAVRRATLYNELKSDLGRAENSAGLTAIAARLGMNEGAVKVALHRLRQRLGELVAEEIKQTVANRDDWREELKYLLDLIGRQPA